MIRADRVSYTSNPSLVPRASWFGSVAASTVHGAHISVALPPAAAAADGTFMPGRVSVSFPVTSTFAPPAGSFNWAVIAGTKGVVASGTTAASAAMLPSLTPSFSAGVEAALSQSVVVVEITEEMSPAATLVVFSPLDGQGSKTGNVVAAQVSFRVASDMGSTLPQSLALSISKDEVRPGAPVTVGVTASVPGSRVFFLAYDVSVALQAGGTVSALTAERALAAVARPQGRDAAGDQATRECYPPTDIDGAAITVLTPLTTSTCNTLQAFLPRPMMMEARGIQARSESDGMESKSESSPSASPLAGVGGGGALASVTRVRSFFPETWGWLDAPTDAVTGIATLEDITAPDTITSWRIAAFATHPTGGLGVSDPAAASSLLRVFKPFFVAPNLPFSAVRGEDLVMRVGIFNYLDFPLAVVAPLPLHV